jgi:hypothetical protein
LGGVTYNELFPRIAHAIAGTQTRILLVSRVEPEIGHALANTSISLAKYKILPQDVRSDTGFRWVWEDIPDPPSLGWSLQGYAARNWHQHITSGICSDAEMRKLAVEFYSEHCAVWRSWRAHVESENSEQEKKEPEAALPGPIYYAAKLRLGVVVASLITELKCDV